MEYPPAAQMHEQDSNIDPIQYMLCNRENRRNVCLFLSVYIANEFSNRLKVLIRISEKEIDEGE
jgi:hypothetical protein